MGAEKGDVFLSLGDVGMSGEYDGTKLIDPGYR